MISRLLKWTAAATVIAALGLSVYCFYVYRQIRNSAVRDEAQPADAIVVLGAAQYNGRPSPVLKARLDHTFDLYSRGYAPVIITTGGYGPDPNFSEAHVSTQYLIKRGVDPGNIVTDQGSVTSYDSIQAAAALMQAKEWKAVLVVSDGFHLYRLKKMFEGHGIVAYTSPAPDSPIEMASSQRLWHSLREVLLFSVYQLFG
jgi:uncharacterized SAM-binding protein YcdF (DUF218 family)